MTEKDWTIERVLIGADHPSKQPDSTHVIVFGRLLDGRPFRWDSDVTDHFLAEYGEDRAKEILADMARPPRTATTSTEI